MKSIVQQEKELAEYQGKDKILPFSELQKELNTKPEGFNVVSYFSQLNEAVGGFSEGELILIGGKPKTGKTLFLQSLTSHFAERGQKLLWFTYEVPLKQFLQSFHKLPEGYAPRQLELGNIWWLEKKIWEAKIKFDTRLVFIDHIHYLIDFSKIRQPSLEIGMVYRKLKLMAIKYHLVIFLISHLRKVGKEEEPQMEDIRDTGLGAGESDTIILIWRVADENGEIGNRAMMKITTRRTGVMEKKVELIKKGEYLEEI